MWSPGRETGGSYWLPAVIGRAAFRRAACVIKLRVEREGGKINALEHGGLHNPKKVISTSKLNTLPHLHFWPINRVVYPDLLPPCGGL